MMQIHNRFITVSRHASVALMFFLATARVFAQDAPLPVVPAAGKIASELYPNSTRGLTKLTKTILKRIQQGNVVAAQAVAKEMILPDPDAWFKNVFGDDWGQRYANGYKQVEDQLPHTLVHLIETLNKEHATDLEARRFDDACDPFATSFEYPLLASREKMVPIYDVRAPNGSNLSILWAFAYVDGGFRYLGNLLSGAWFRYNARSSPGRDLKSSAVRVDNSTGKLIRVAGEVQSAKLIRSDPPIYPPQAMSSHMQGSVILHGLIAKDGSLQEIELVEGQCLLAQAAIEAVRHWKYKPTLFNGQPTEVETSITVIFTLGG